MERLALEFPRYNDVSLYDGREVKFYKLTQLGFWQIYSGLGAAGGLRLEDPQKMTAFADYIVPVALRNHKGEPTGESLTEDDHRRPQTTMEGLAKLKPAFGKNGTVTAGNASGIVDGAAALVMMSLDEARKRNLVPLGRIVSWGYAGVEPKVMGRGPVPASPNFFSPSRSAPTME